MRNLLGGKGANLAEMSGIGLPVPPGFTITTEVCSYYYDHECSYPEALLAQVPEAPRRERQRRLLEHGLDAPDVSAAVGTYRELIQAMDRALAETEWVAGGQFSLADASLAPYFQTLHQFDWLDLFVDSDRVTRWYERCRERDSYREAVSRDFPTETLAQLRRDGQAAREQVAVHLPPATAQ